MKSARLIFILVIMALWAAVVPVMAQTDELTPVTFRDGFTVVYPEGWEATTDEDDILLLVSDSMGLYMFLYSLDDLENMQVEPGDTVALLEAYHNLNMSEGSDPFDATLTQTVTVNGRDILYFEPTILGAKQDPYQTMRGAMVLDESGRIVAFGAFPLTDTEVSGTEEILDIVASAETGTYYLGDGSSFSYPPAWDSYVDDDGYIRLYNDDTNIRLEFISPESLAELNVTPDDLVPAMVYAFGSANDETLVFDPLSVKAFAAGEHRGLWYEFTDSYEGQAYQRVFMLIRTPDGWANLFDVVPNVAATIAPEDLESAVAIMSSFTLPRE